MSGSSAGAGGGSALISISVPHFGHFAFFPALSAENFIGCWQDLQRIEMASIDAHSSHETVLALDRTGAATKVHCMGYSRRRNENAAAVFLPSPLGRGAGVRVSAVSLQVRPSPAAPLQEGEAR